MPIVPLSGINNATECNCITRTKARRNVKSLVPPRPEIQSCQKYPNEIDYLRVLEGKQYWLAETKLPTGKSYTTS
ncbi:hypothetical protein JMJ78_0001731 [Colletotrichum scovillei]|nr:hypothetical protein JMJ78_0001731 [Colletotrichum scovillei]